MVALLKQVVAEKAARLKRHASKSDHPSEVNQKLARQSAFPELFQRTCLLKSATREKLKSHLEESSGHACIGLPSLRGQQQQLEAARICLFNLLVIRDLGPKSSQDSENSTTAAVVQSRCESLDVLKLRMPYNRR